jgi:hypothetical protein
MSSILGRVRFQSGSGRPRAANREKVTVALDAEMVARTHGALDADDAPDVVVIERK